MSHLKGRIEKNCLNCNAEVLGRYCHVCGQENVEVKESFWHLATHLVYDIMHFDSKFFDTLKYLLSRPGFLSKEYLRGRRSSYLHPIRMYVFTSAIFFIIFFAFIVTPSDMENNAGNTTNSTKNKTGKDLHEHVLLLQDSLKRTTDVRQRQKIQDEINTLNNVSSYIPQPDESKDSVGTSNNNGAVFRWNDSMPKTAREYDSSQKILPEDQRDNWLKRVVMYRSISINQKYKGDEERFKEDLVEKFKHSVPQMMFLSLPLIALVLQLLYIRRRKQFYYVDHVMLLIHVYIAIFITLLIYYAFDALHRATGLGLFVWLSTITAIYVSLYGYFAMYRFYRQGIIKTALKYLILLIVGSILTSVLLVIFIITSFFQI